MAATEVDGSGWELSDGVGLDPFKSQGCRDDHGPVRSNQEGHSGWAIACGHCLAGSGEVCGLGG